MLLLLVQVQLLQLLEVVLPLKLLQLLLHNYYFHHHNYHPSNYHYCSCYFCSKIYYSSYYCYQSNIDFDLAGHGGSQDQKRGWIVEKR